MIKLIRLDERLIHGQVAIKWSRHTGVDRILVINNEAAANQTIQRSLMMAAPQNIKVAIKSFEDGIKILKDPRMDTVKVLVIVSEIQDLYQILLEKLEIPTVNIGNYGRIAAKKAGETRKTYRSNLYAYDDEVALLKKIIDLGYKVEYQTTPEDPAEPLANII